MTINKSINQDHITTLNVQHQNKEGEAEVPNTEEKNSQEKLEAWRVSQAQRINILLQTLLRCTGECVPHVYTCITNPTHVHTHNLQTHNHYIHNQQPHTCAHHNHIYITPTHVCTHMYTHITTTYITNHTKPTTTHVHIHNHIYSQQLHTCTHT